MARAVRLAGLVANPPKIIVHAMVELGMRKWKDHQRTLANNCRESFWDKVMVWILLQRLPKQANALWLGPWETR